MDNSEIILKVLDETKANHEAQIRGLQKAIDSGFDALNIHLTQIVEQNKVRNGRIEKLEKVTFIGRFIHNNPVKAAIIFVVSCYGSIELFNHISIVELIKKLI